MELAIDKVEMPTTANGIPVIAIEDILQSSCSVGDGKANDQAMQWIPPKTIVTRTIPESKNRPTHAVPPPQRTSRYGQCYASYTKNGLITPLNNPTKTFPHDHLRNTRRNPSQALLNDSRERDQ